MEKKNGLDWGKIAVPALMVGMASLAAVPDVFAITTPAGGFAQDVYDVVVTDMLQGPVGFVAGVGAIAFGAYSAVTSRILPAVSAIGGGAILLKADDIVSSMGMLV